jgi:4-amino-4-deoxy-L-arabinose transferase and related glycosyltransferases of PMT family
MNSDSKADILKLALPGVLIAILLLAPFLNKAFTIDDPTFLLEARQILKTPLQPWSFPICYGDNLCVTQAGNMGANAREGLMGYVLVPVILTGGAEWLAHLIQILLVCLVVFEMVALAFRVGLSRIQAAVAGLFVVAIPPLLSMASTAMPDVLALALGLSGIERLLAWKDERRWHQAAVAALALGLAPYARPHFALFLPLGALWLLDELKIRKAFGQFRRQAVLWMPVLVAGLVLFAVNFFTRPRGSGVERNMEIGFGNIPLNLFAYLHYLSFPIPLTVVWFVRQWRTVKIIILVFSVPVVAAHFMAFSPKSVVWEFEVAAVLFGGALIVDMSRVQLRARNRVGILLLLWMLIPLPAVIYAHFPIKYMMAVTPAIVLILIKLLSNVPSRLAYLAYAIIVAMCAGYSLILLRADANFAESSREAVRELVAPRVAAGERVWFGGDWGFYWYAQEAGARVSRPDEPGPNRGELLVVGLMESGGLTLQRFPNRELIKSRSYNSPHGRTMGYGAGLYSNYYGLLPWRWNPGATNVYQVWRIH